MVAGDEYLPPALRQLSAADPQCPVLAGVAFLAAAAEGIGTGVGRMGRHDAAKIKAEENLDGKYLLRTSGPQLPTEDIALGYKQLCEAGRSWRDLKQVIGLRPVYHRTEERIRAHVILRWLALLLIRVAETTAGTTWNKIGDEFSLLTLGTFTGPAGTFRQTANSPRPGATSWPNSRSRTRRRSSRPPPPRLPDQRQHHRLVTRPVTTPACVPARQTPDPGTMPCPHLRSSGLRPVRNHRPGCRE